MSVTSYDVGDKFILRVIKSLATNPDRKWANSYEFEAVAAGTEGPLLDLGDAWLNFEAQIHWNTVRFTQFIISTWEPDSVPYDPETFVSIPVAVSGARGPLDEQLPLNQACSVARVPVSGRFGHLFYRGMLNENDVNAPAGKSALVDKIAVKDLIDTAIDDNSLQDYFTAGGANGFRMVMVNKTGTQVRGVVGLTVVGVSTLPLDHAWFNRTTISVPA